MPYVAPPAMRLPLPLSTGTSRISPVAVSIPSWQCSCSTVNSAIPTNALSDTFTCWAISSLMPVRRPPDASCFGNAAACPSCCRQSKPPCSSNPTRQPGKTSSSPSPLPPAQTRPPLPRWERVGVRVTIRNDHLPLILSLSKDHGEPVEPRGNPVPHNTQNPVHPVHRSKRQTPSPSMGKGEPPAQTPSPSMEEGWGEGEPPAHPEPVEGRLSS